MASSAKCRCHWGMLKVNNLRHSYINIMIVENSGYIIESSNQWYKFFTNSTVNL